MNRRIDQRVKLILRAKVPAETMQGRQKTPAELTDGEGEHPDNQRKHGVDKGDEDGRDES